jgi:TolB-like protein
VPDPLNPADVVAALERVLASQAFASAGRLSRMLRYVVEKTLAGEVAQIKEYSVGVEVFDRPADYDPRLDSIVRVEARRLRARLAEYYDGEGRDDAIRFRLPKGGYAPTFGPAGEDASAAERAPAGPRSTRSVRRWWLAAGVCALAALGAAKYWMAASSASASSVVTIAVLPFQVFSGRDADRLLADRLTDGITTELARNSRLGVTAHAAVGRFKDPQRSWREAAAELGVRVVMEGTAHVDGDDVRLEVRLVDADLGRKLWVEEFQGRRDAPDGLEYAVASQTAQVLIQRFGRP